MGENRMKVDSPERIWIWRNGYHEFTLSFVEPKNHDYAEYVSVEANRELTRQVEQLRARIDAAEKDAARYRYLRRDLSDPDLDRTHCSLEVHQQVNEGDDKPWRCWRTYGQALDVQVDLAIADLAITAPPSSSDPGRADTGREER